MFFSLQTLQHHQPPHLRIIYSSSLRDREALCSVYCFSDMMADFRSEGKSRQSGCVVGPVW